MKITILIYRLKKYRLEKSPLFFFLFYWLNYSYSGSTSREITTETGSHEIEGTITGSYPIPSPSIAFAWTHSKAEELEQDVRKLSCSFPKLKLAFLNWNRQRLGRLSNSLSSTASKLAPSVTKLPAIRDGTEKKELPSTLWSLNISVFIPAYY